MERVLFIIHNLFQILAIRRLLTRIAFAQ
jgi:hypothetical protein